MAWIQGIWWTQRSPIRSTSGASVRSIEISSLSPSITHNAEHCCEEAPGTAKVMCLQVSRWVFWCYWTISRVKPEASQECWVWLYALEGLWQWRVCLLWSLLHTRPSGRRWRVCTLPSRKLPLVGVIVRASQALLILITSGRFTLSITLHRPWQTGMKLEPRDIAFATSFLLTQKQSLPVYFFPWWRACQGKAGF